VSFGLFLCTLFAFDLLLGELYRWHRSAGAAPEQPARLPEWAWLALGYAVFIWSSVVMLNTATLTPDMCVAAIAYAVFALLLRVGLGDDRRRTYAALGALLGLGYLAKAPMLPVGVAVLIVLGFMRAGARGGLPRVLIAALCFAAVASPFVAALSARQGRLSLGESGGLNYAWHVNKMTSKHWQGDPVPIHGAPLHPTRKLLDEPAVFEFGTPVGGTYPPWYDPYYWNEGYRLHFSPRRQLKAIWDNMEIYIALLGGRFPSALAICLIILFFVSARGWSIVCDVAAHYFLIVPSLAALGMYVLVHVEGRYVAPFVTVLLLSLLSSLRLSGTRESERLVACVTVIALTVFSVEVARAAAPAALDAARDLRRPASSPYAEVARRLRSMGVEQGEKVAVVGDAKRAYWARLARARVVAEITYNRSIPGDDYRDVNTFWKADPALKERVLSVLAGTGARAVVADHVPDWASTAGWQQVEGTEYFLHPLSP
jgi:hypothetical protein